MRVRTALSSVSRFLAHHAIYSRNAAAHIAKQNFVFFFFSVAD